MRSAVPLPPWAEYFKYLGQSLAEIPTVDYGEPALRVVLSVPTGRFTYWLLASGALEQPPLHPNDFVAGDRVACWVAKRMKDVVLEDGKRSDEWRLEPGVSVMKEKLVAVKVPDGTPDDRRSGSLAADYKKRLQEVPGHSGNYHIWFAQHSLKPVVVVGTGREHIQQQRKTLLEHVPKWFTTDTCALLNDDSAMTSSPERMLHHPYMVFDAVVGKNRPWLRQMVPRLVIVTSWSSHQRMARSLFSRAPQIIITNRRVRSASSAEVDLRDVSETHQLDKVLNAGRPPGVGLLAYFEPAQGDSTEDESFDDVEELI